MSRQAIVALELRHDEKVIGGKLSKKQAIYLFPTAFLCYGLTSVPFDILLKPFFGESLSTILSYGIMGFVTIIAMGIAALLAFLPAHLVPWLKNPKPTVNTDPYDRPVMLDDYLLMKFHNHHKTKLLPWRGGRSGWTS